MTDHEKEILDKIKQSTEKTPVPESLAPDQIMKMLEEHNNTQASGHILKSMDFPRPPDARRTYRCRTGTGCRHWRPHPPAESFFKLIHFFHKRQFFNRYILR